MANFEAMRKDLARGGGESLRTLAALAGGLQALEVSEASLRSRRFLIDAPSAPAFVDRFGAALAARANPNLEQPRTSFTNQTRDIRYTPAG